MIFRVWRASDWKDDDKVIEIKSLEELLSFAKKEGDIIIKGAGDEIIIYDDYLE